MIRLSGLLFAAAGFSLALATTAEADQHCASVCAAALEPQQELLCAVPDTSGPVAGITYSSGPVQVSAPGGLSTATADTPVGIGDHLMVLEGGELGLSGPGCDVAIGGPALISVIPANGCACVAAEIETVAPTGDRTALLAALGLGAGAGALIFILADDDDDTSLPVSP